MRLLFIPRDEADVVQVIDLHRYCLENDLVLDYLDYHYTIELPFSSPHITYILLHFELAFSVVN